MLFPTTGGIAFNYVNRQIASGLLLLLMGTGTILLPIVPSLLLFFVTAAIVGFGGAGYDTAQIVWIIEMWETKAAAYIQTQHFCFALGTLVSPLLMKSFLPMDTLETNDGGITLQSDILTTAEGIGTNNTTLLYQSETLDSDQSSQLYVPFLIGGIFTIIGGILLLLLYGIKKYEKPSKSGVIANEDNNQTDPGKSKGCNCRKLILILLSAVVLGAYSGMELCSFQFLPTFTHFIDLKLSQQDGALVLSGLAAAFTVGRAIGIFIVLKIRPEILLLGNILLVITGNTLLLFFANSSLPILWGGAILLGIGFSTVFPSFYGYIEQHLKVSNVVGASMIVAGGLVSSLYPIIIGSFIEKNPFILMYTNYFSLVACTSAFLVIYTITRKKPQERNTYSVTSGNVDGKAENPDLLTAGGKPLPITKNFQT